MVNKNKKDLNHEMFTNKDGHLEGGVEIEATNTQENMRKEKEGEERLSLDKMRAMMNQQNIEDKMDQNEDLAKLRADTSIQKTVLSKTLPNAKDMMGGSIIIGTDKK